jgi:hypothetical protein
LHQSLHPLAVGAGAQRRDAVGHARQRLAGAGAEPAAGVLLEGQAPGRRVIGGLVRGGALVDAGAPGRAGQRAPSQRK